jgi:hypothetical protein
MHDVLVGRYIAEREPFEGQIVAARIDLRGLDYDAYIVRVKKRYKGNVIRDARKADRMGCSVKRFDPTAYIDDIVAINHSTDERCGRPMTEPYRRDVEQMQRDAERAIEFQPPVCPWHYDHWWGVFVPPAEGGTDGHRNRLVAYIRLRRNGTYALYAQILGHADYLKHGVMYRLHFSIMEWLCARRDESAQGIEQLVYAGFYQGAEGLQLWKKKTAFEPALLVLDEKSTECNRGRQAAGHSA